MCPLAEVDQEDCDNYVKALESIFQNPTAAPEPASTMKGIPANSESTNASAPKTVVHRMFDKAEDSLAEMKFFTFPGQKSTAGSTVAMSSMWKNEVGREWQDLNRLVTDDSNQFPSLGETTEATDSERAPRHAEGAAIRRAPGVRNAPLRKEVKASFK